MGTLSDRKLNTGEGGISSLTRYAFRAGSLCPALRLVLLSMDFIPEEELVRPATDGFRFYVPADPDAGAKITFEDFTHMLVHCVFLHINPPEGIIPSLWNLASDMAAEYIRTELFPCDGAAEIRRAVTDAVPDGTDPRVPLSLYRALGDLFEDDLAYLMKRFQRDDHRYFFSMSAHARQLASDKGAFSPKDSEEDFTAGNRSSSAGFENYEVLNQDALRARVRELLALRWSPVSEALLTEVSSMRRYGLTPGSKEERMVLHEVGRYDFSRYLRRFSVLREELQPDEGSFDYIPYCFGLKTYGNLPLIEPLEYTEAYRISELVIAIDTSGSCSLPTVSRFLGEIERMLMHKENFFRKMQLHLIQCDAIIQDHQVIRDLDDWKSYRKNLTIKGRGGTNFLPVFTLVDRLREEGTIRNLKGLLYFTDGDGVYPSKEPPYEVAFVFSKAKALSYKLPSWIIKLCLTPETEMIL